MSSVVTKAVIPFSYKYKLQAKHRYSFIQLSELDQFTVNKLTQGLTTDHRSLNQVLIVESNDLASGLHLHVVDTCHMDTGSLISDQM